MKDELVRLMQLSAQANAQTKAPLRADKVVPYGCIFEIMGAAQTTGLNRIGFMVDAPAPAPKP